MKSTSAMLIFSVIFLISCSVGIETNNILGYNVQSAINIIFDLILKKYTEHLVHEGRTKVKIPDIQKTFSDKILSINVKGGIILNDGWCSNISTVYRTGDADMQRTDRGVILTTHIGVRELKVDYNNYNVFLLNKHHKGNVHVDIGNNSVWIKLKVQLRPNCVIALTDMKIEELMDINVKISNLGIFNHLTQEITSLVANEVTKFYRGYVEQTIFPKLANIVMNADLCHYLLPF